MKAHDHKVNWTGHCECGAYPSASGLSWFKLEGAVPANFKHSPETQAIVDRLHKAVRDFKASLPIR